MSWSVSVQPRLMFIKTNENSSCNVEQECQLNFYMLMPVIHWSVQHENVELIPPRTLKFDFLGKDSIRYENSHEVSSCQAPVLPRCVSGTGASFCVR